MTTKGECSMRRIIPAAQRQAAQERADELYERVSAEVEDEMRAEWERHFGKDNPTFPFTPHPQTIHAVTVSRIARCHAEEE
jgi:hypothetical protein